MADDLIWLKIGSLCVSIENDVLSPYLHGSRNWAEGERAILSVINPTSRHDLAYSKSCIAN